MKNAHTISQEDALNTAEKFVGTKGLAFESLSENTAIPSYTFVKNTDSNQISISITKDGGYILSYLNSRNIDGERLDINSATDKAAEIFAEKTVFTVCRAVITKNQAVSQR